MAQHKAPTAVTLAPTKEASGFALWIERNWKLATLALLLIAGAVIFRQCSRETERAEHDSSWERLLNVASEDPATGTLSGSAKDLLAIDAQVRGTPAGPWAAYIAATSALTKREFDAADAALDRLKNEYPDHVLVTKQFSFDGSATKQTTVEYLRAKVAAQRAWSAQHAALFQNPELPADAPRVRLNTDRGAIVLGLYANLAPKHVENYLKLVREGYYTGTKFHRVIVGFMIQGGDPNTIKGDVATWGQGGPDYKIDFEANSLRHFAGVLSAAKQEGEEQSAGSQFFITTGDANHLDGKHVVFGKVLEGMDVVTQIEHGAVVPGTDRPEEPVTIQSAEVL